MVNIKHIKRLEEIRKNMLDLILEAENILKEDADEYRLAVYSGWLGKLYYTTKDDFAQYIRYIKPL